MATVELEEVHKRFGEAHILKGISLSIGDGEFLVLVGPSGCGKSTCLRSIAGLEEISSGHIRIGGRLVDDVAPKDRDIGMVFQSYALYPHMTVRENLAFGLTLRKAPPQTIADRVGEAARMLGLETLLGRKPKQLSGGQRQRVAMGRAIVRQPRVFLFDEPLSNLDAALRVQMRGELAALHKRLGATMIYVTHDQVEAMMLATRIAVLDRGVLQQVGTPHELYHAPRNRFVASFIGSPAMNFLDGELSSVGGTLNFRAPGIQLGLDGCALGPAAAGGRVALGVRPHDFSVGEGGFQTTVELVEPMGWEAFVHARCDAGKLVVRLEGAAGERIRAGDKLPLRVDVGRVHFFDAEGRRLP